ncbi:MAG: CaiB/BaiF CoA transferase family protein [Mycobacteriales bacterium]
MTADGPLAGLLVVDLSRVLAGPFCTRILCDLGARVVKVERPGTGDDSRSYGPFKDGQSLYFARVNRGKESIALDLKSADGREVLDALLAHADVLVENFRPGVMERLGYGPATLTDRFPRLVALSLSGFGHTGPWSQRPAYDAVVQGMAGVMAITGAVGGDPVKPGVPVADLSAGLYGAVAVVSAVHERARTGRGQHLDVAMFDTTMSLLEGAALRWLATGDSPDAIGNAHFAIAPFDTFACADRQIVICAANDGLFAKLCAELGLDLGDDARFAGNAARHENEGALKALLEGALAAAPAAEWLVRLEAAGVPCGPVASIAEAVGSEQAVARTMVVDAGGLPVPGNPIKSSAHADPQHVAGPPDLDADGPAIRTELGLPERPV